MSDKFLTSVVFAASGSVYATKVELAAKIPSGVTMNTGTTAERTALGLTLTTANIGTDFYDETEERPYRWNGTDWV